jgi:membrane fusion protein
MSHEPVKPAQQSLYREQALRARHPEKLGAVLLLRPPLVSVLTALSVLVGILLLLFFCFAKYTRKTSVSGQLMPSVGVVKVIATQPGVVEQRLVDDDQPVSKGQPLYLISNETHQGAQGNAQGNISAQVKLRIGSMRDELTKTIVLQQEEQRALSNKIANLKDEFDKAGLEIASQQSRHKIAEHSLELYRSLREKNYVSQENLMQKEAEVLEQRSRVESLERARIAVQREMEAQASERNSLPLRHENQLASIQRAIAEAGQQLEENEAKRNTVVLAPLDGIATAVTAQAGQAVDSGRPLMTLVPAAAQLRAYLLVPSRAIGFINIGEKVMLRYQAYPYQKFGQATGSVLNISRTALSATELSGSTTQSSQQEPMFKITVELARQDIQAYGKQIPLQAGLLLDADIMHERRTIVEWVMEPLISLTGKL